MLDTLEDVKNDIFEGTKEYIGDRLERIEKMFTGDEGRSLQRGDIVCVSRGVYDHYGVYINSKRVIHYTSLNSDISTDNKIMETTFNTFLKGEKQYIICDFPASYGKPREIVINQLATVGIIDSLAEAIVSWINKNKNYKRYSPDETAQRAISKIGEDNYSVLNNNCEHFAIWCKTGIHESHQVNSLVKIIKYLSQIHVNTH